MVGRRRQEALAASQAAVHRLVETGGAAGVVELAAAAGVSRRTWHRYFPAKEDLLRPVLRDAGDLVLRVVAERSAGAGVVGAFIEGFAAAAAGLFTTRTRGLMPILAASPALDAVLEHEGALTALHLRRLLEARFDVDDVVAAALSTALVALSISSLRDASRESVSPTALLADRVRALGLPEIVPSPTTGERRRT